MSDITILLKKLVGIKNHFKIEKTATEIFKIMCNIDILKIYPWILSLSDSKINERIWIRRIQKVAENENNHESRKSKSNFRKENQQSNYTN